MSEYEKYKGDLIRLFNENTEQKKKTTPKTNKIPLLTSNMNFHNCTVTVNHIYEPKELNDD